MVRRQGRVEELAVTEDRAADSVAPDFLSRFAGRRVLVTGHTGFKGSWLCLWLRALGAEVTGLALPPSTRPNHFSLLGLAMDDRRCDIRDAAAVRDIIVASRPDLVFHLAAQPLVRASYADPLHTWSTNVIGTASVLEACRAVPGLRAVVVATTDKCYENDGRASGYTEGDRLGGHDPYSASKAAAELVTASYRLSFFNAPDGPLIATARAGNVIGGGDWSADRLIPDLARAVAAGETLDVRSPEATRPWQHVLDALHGYLRLGASLLDGARDHAAAWNFGPNDAGNRCVADVLNLLKNHWPGAEWRHRPGPQPHEAALLQLDSSHATAALNWRPVWSLAKSLEMTAAWYRAYLEDGRAVSAAQLAAYQTDLRGAP